jgi:hypothetical protein
MVVSLLALTLLCNIQQLRKHDMMVPLVPAQFSPGFPAKPPPSWNPSDRLEFDQVGLTFCFFSLRSCAPTRLPARIPSPLDYHALGSSPRATPRAQSLHGTLRTVSSSIRCQSLAVCFPPARPRSLPSALSWAVRGGLSPAPKAFMEPFGPSRVRSGANPLPSAFRPLVLTHSRVRRAVAMVRCSWAVRGGLPSARKALLEPFGRARVRPVR